MRLDTCSFSLHCLRPPYLVTFTGGEGVEGHVLRFERRDIETILPQDAAQRSHRERLARVGSCAQYHQRLCQRLSSVTLPNTVAVSSARAETPDHPTML